MLTGRFVLCALCLFALVLPGCVTTPYKAPANATAKIDFAYIELGDNPGVVEVTGFGKYNPWVGTPTWDLGKLTPGPAKTPEVAPAQISVPIVTERDFEYAFTFTSNADKNIVCQNWVQFTPVPNAHYLAVFFNKSTSCHPQVFRRTLQGLVPEPSMRKPAPRQYAQPQDILL